MRPRLCLALAWITLAMSAGAEEPTLERGQAVRSDTSRPLRETVSPARPPLPSGFQVEVPLGKPPSTPTAPAPEPDAGGPVQSAPGGRLTPAVDQSFEGLAETDNTTVHGFVIVPPDTNGDIGFDHLGNKIYVQTINLAWGIFDAATGSLISGPTSLNSFWSGFGGDCESDGDGFPDGDPIVLYDDYAGRWVFAQFVRNKGLICVAVSATSDPLGSYHRYAFLLASATGTADYPKLGVWPQDAESAESGLPNQSSFTLTTRNFPFTTAEFSQSILLERDLMLTGDPGAQFVRFPHACSIFPTGCEVEGQAPPHFAGPPPPFGTCPTFVAIRDKQFDDFNQPSDGVLLHRICVDWVDTANTTFVEGYAPTTVAFSRALGDGYDTCISQRPSPGELLACLTRFTMYRAQFRYFDGSDGNGTHVSAVVNSTVKVGSETPVAGVHWIELRSDTGMGGWAIHQQGSFGPDDGRERWMGSIAQNGNRALALGFSRMSGTEMPSIYYTTRYFDDPAGELGTEQVCHDGTGVQTASAGRWGDYSAMSVDPEDDCTFWYTSEYYETTGSFDFKTRICSFNGCNLAPVVTIEMPVDGSEFDDQTSILFAGTAADPEDGDISAALEWTSSLDGAIGTGASFSAMLTAGPHTIETSAADSGNRPGSAQVAIDVSSAGCPLHLDLVPETITTLDERRAVNTINVLAGVVVDSSGDLRLFASQSIAFENGFSLLAGGALRIETTADPCG